MFVQMVRGVVFMVSSKVRGVSVLMTTATKVDTNVEKDFGQVLRRSCGPALAALPGPKNDFGPEAAGWGSDLRPESRNSR